MKTYDHDMPDPMELSDALFGEVFVRYHDRVLTWCWRISRNRDRADDLAQEVFIKAWRRRHSFRGESSLSTWLYAIARNHCLTAIKRQDRAVPLDSVDYAKFRDRSMPQPDVAAERNDLSGKVLQMMKRSLEPLEARVMTLHYGHEEPLASITEQLNLLNPSGAKAYIVNGRRKMRGVLKRRGWIDAAPDTQAA